MTSPQASAGSAAREGRRNGRRVLVATLVAVAALCLPGVAPAADVDTAAWAALQRDGAILLLRHANAPGVGDPPGFQLGDCSSQRNLDATGRAQARRIGEGLRARGVAVRAVYSSRWCRARETADLAFPGLASEQAVFDSFFGERRDEPARTAAARTLLAQWKGPGVLAVTTHQVNITALTGVAPASGEGVVVRVDGERVEVLGRVAP